MTERPFDPMEALAAEGIPVPQEIDPTELTPLFRFNSIEELLAGLEPGLPAEIKLSDIAPELRDQLMGGTPLPIFRPLPPVDFEYDTGHVLPAARVSTPVGGQNPKDLLGAKKPDLSVVPPAAMLHLAAAMMDGAAKYGSFNWRDNAVLARVYVAAAMRHLLQFLDGEDSDPVSRVHHLGHAMACCAIVLDADETGNLSDDRPSPGAAGDMIRRWSPEGKFDG